VALPTWQRPLKLKESADFAADFGRFRVFTAPIASIIRDVSHGGLQHERAPNDRPGRRRRVWQPRLFPELVEPLNPPAASRSPTSHNAGSAAHFFRRGRPTPERVNLDAPRPRLTAEPRAWLDAIDNDETRRAYRRDALDLMRRLGLDTEPKLICLERRDAVRYRDLLQGLVTAGNCSTGLARRRMAAALSLYDHLQQRYLVPHNPFFKLPRPREADGRVADAMGGRGGGIGGCGNGRRRRACRRPDCPLAVLNTAGAPEKLPRRRPSCGVAGVEPQQLHLW
jgi:hypothetical protein